MSIRRCWEDLSGFLGIFFLAFGAFVQMFYLILFSELDEFKGLLRSFETCFTIMLNKFDFGKIKVRKVLSFSSQMKSRPHGRRLSLMWLLKAFRYNEIGHGLTPSNIKVSLTQETNTIAAVMFFFFAVSVSWVLVNVLLTIIIDGYENVKKELEGRKNELEVIQYIKVINKWINYLYKAKCITITTTNWDGSTSWHRE